ncbi:DUF983 domain-containing protein [Planctomicrobium sp. SH664]|uniref:DUF983 domain-containing protein n=1 Tax=Planctomicrobium sp. SH664 TaxID=3448125 RepID=UPI003F5C26D7
MSVPAPQGGDHNSESYGPLPGGLPRPSSEELLGRALRLRCPRCGQGRLFRSFFLMPDKCPDCGFRFNPEPGFYLGSMYVNYGATALITTIAFMVGRIHLGIASAHLVWPLGAFSILFPIIMFRHSRALWLALDCLFDSSTLERDPHQRADP